MTQESLFGETIEHPTEKPVHGGNIGISTEIDVAGLTRTPGITRTTIKPQSTSGSSPTATRSSCSARAGCSRSATRPATRAS